MISSHLLVSVEMREYLTVDHEMSSIACQGHHNTVDVLIVVRFICDVMDQNRVGKWKTVDSLFT